MGKRQQGELPLLVGMGELTVLRWYQQVLQLCKSSCNSGSHRLMQLHQCFSASTSTLSQQPDYFDISISWKEVVRIDGCFIMARRQKSADQMPAGKHRSTHSAQQPHAVGPPCCANRRVLLQRANWKCIQRKAEDVATLKDFFISTYLLWGA